MSKNRIHIDGHWYVREDMESEVLEICETSELSYEDDLICLAASKFMGGAEMWNVQIIDKRVKGGFITHNYDAMIYLRNLVNGDSETYSTEVATLGEYGAKTLKLFLTQIRNEYPEWL